MRMISQQASSNSQHLGPTIFLLYINGLLMSKFLTRENIYADDTRVSWMPFDTSAWPLPSIWSLHWHNPIDPGEKKTDCSHCIPLKSNLYRSISEQLVKFRLSQPTGLLSSRILALKTPLNLNSPRPQVDLYILYVVKNARTILDSLYKELIK